MISSSEKVYLSAQGTLYFLGITCNNWVYKGTSTLNNQIDSNCNQQYLNSGHSFFLLRINF